MPRLTMLFAYPLTHQDGVTRFADHLRSALYSCLGIEVIPLAPRRLGAAPRRPLLQLLLAAELVLGLIRLRPSVVHVHEHPAVLLAAVVYRAMFREPVRIVYTVHVEPTQRRAHWKRLILGWLMARCAVVTAVSRHTADRLYNIASPVPRRITVIHGGAEIEPRTPDDPALSEFRARWRLHAGPVLCQIGLNFPRKVEGALRLIEAMPLIRREFPETRLILVGEGPLRRQAERRRDELGLGDVVIVTGWLDDVSVPLSLADIYCHVTLQDACPLSILEAMRCGKPIVAARTGGIPELITDGVDGELVQPEADAVAACVVALVKDPLRSGRLGELARETAVERFSWRTVAANFAAAYGLAGDGS